MEQEQLHMVFLTEEQMKMIIDMQTYVFTRNLERWGD